MAVLEGDTRLPANLGKNSRVAFTGKIFDGVDSFGLKEVQVLIREPDELILVE